MKRTILILAALGLAGCFQPIDENAKSGLNQGAGGSGGGAGGGTATSPSQGDPGAGVGPVCTSVTISGAAMPPSSPCYCTRRDAVPNGDCPRGTNAQASATIGPEGGELTLTGNQGIGVKFSITFPKGALAADTVITVTETSVPPPPGSVDFSPVYRISPTDLVLAEPATLKVPFSQGRGSYNFDSQLSLFWSNEAANPCALERLPSGYVNAGFMNANTGRLGYAFVAYPAQGNATYCK